MKTHNRHAETPSVLLVTPGAMPTVLTTLATAGIRVQKQVGRKLVLRAADADRAAAVLAHLRIPVRSPHPEAPSATGGVL